MKVLTPLAAMLLCSVFLPAGAQDAASAVKSKSTAQAEAGEPRAQTSTPQAEAGEPRVQTSPKPAADSRAATPKPPSGKASSAAAKPSNSTDKLDLGLSTVTGDREQPKVMYIVPWKRADMGDLDGKPMNSLVDEILSPVDRDVFKREVTYYRAVQADASQNGAAPKSSPQGEK